MFINSSTALPERYERRVYGNGKVGQVIVFLFSGYALEKKPAALAYTLPDGYKSEMFDKRGSHVTLKEGTAAPSFQVKDIQGNTISLESLRGKKVLLDFSIMGCGYCKMALDHFSRDGFRLPENVVGVYISPTDKGSTMLKYTQQTKIPFPVVAGAKDVGSLYSVYAYPTFYLIDENGMIEKVVVGYDKEFIEGLSMP
jgi:peroxiredoxin